MVTTGPRSIATARVGLSTAILGVALELFGLTTSFPWYIALVLGGSGAGAAIALRLVSGGQRTDTAALLVLLDLGVLAAGAPDTRAAGIAGGVVVLALLFWLADEPGHVSGGMRRALPTIGLVSLAFGVAWVSAFLLPPTSVPTGAIAGVLVGVVLLATILFARPELIEREPRLTS
jgi:hypothetical protein